MKLTLLASAMLLLAVAGSAAAGSPINETHKADANARIDVSNIKGTVTVSGWDRDEVAVSGSLGDGAKELAIDGTADHHVIKVQPPDKQGWFSWGADSRMGDTLLDLKVPRGAEMKIEVVSADVALTGVGGRLLDVNSVSGKVRLDSDAKEVEIDSVSGNIDLTGKAERGHLETVSGNIRARGLGGTLKFETVSGDVDAENGDYRELSAGTVSGDINLRGKPAKDARVDVETMSGDVHLYVPSDLSAHLRATTFSGSIRSDFGTVKDEDHGPGSSLDATTGEGDSRVNLQTFSGDIEVRRQ
jgi:DUF4097 and DUF4098 domain-containing protein YvlB